MFTGLSLNATRDQVAAAYGQNEVARQGQFTDRYTKAVDQLDRAGPEHIQARLGGIYALQRLAADSPQDQPTIVNVLVAFIASTVQRAEPATGATCQEQIAPDIEAAFTVLTQRDHTHDAEHSPDRGMSLRRACLARGRLALVELLDADLSEAILTGADLRGAKLNGANLARADLTTAYLYAVDLGAATLPGAVLNKADLTLAHLREANLVGATLTEARLWWAELIDTDLSGATLARAEFNEATLQKANLSKADLRGAIFTNTQHSDTKVDEAVIDATTIDKWW